MNQKLVYVNRDSDIIIVQNRGVEEVYQDTLENFTIDNGTPVPEGINTLDRCWETDLALMNGEAGLPEDVEAWAVALVEEAGELYQKQYARLNPPSEPEPEPTEAEKALKAKIEALNEAEAYLFKTDYAVIKCVELGLDLEAEYPGLSAKRQEARNKVNAVEAEIAALRASLEE